MLDEYLLGEGYGLSQRALEEIERVANEALEYGSMATDAGAANAEVERWQRYNISPASRTVKRRRNIGSLPAPT